MFIENSKDIYGDRRETLDCVKRKRQRLWSEEGITTLQRSEEIFSLFFKIWPTDRLTGLTLRRAPEGKQTIIFQPKRGKGQACWWQKKSATFWPSGSSIEKATTLTLLSSVVALLIASNQLLNLRSPSHFFAHSWHCLYTSNCFSVLVSLTDLSRRLTLPAIGAIRQNISKYVGLKI